MTTAVHRTHIDLFSGLGGFALAAATNNVTTQIFCEQNENCCNFLASAWGLPIIRDVRNFDGTQWRGAWLLTAGVPCQPASRAGKQKGARDDRWLWPEALRVAEESRATWLLFENPPGLNEVGLDGVLSEVERIGYEVGTLEIPACAVNSLQLRNRLWIVGHARCSERGPGDEAGRHTVTRPDGKREAASRAEESNKNRHVANGENCNRGLQLRIGRQEQAGAEPIWRALWDQTEWVACLDARLRRAPIGLHEMADGVSTSLLEALGNSIVWPIAGEVIEAMIAAEDPCDHAEHPAP